MQDGLPMLHLSMASPGHGIDFYVLDYRYAGAGTLIGGINFLVTIINMRAPGMTLYAYAIVYLDYVCCICT